MITAKACVILPDGFYLFDPMIRSDDLPAAGGTGRKRLHRLKTRRITPLAVKKSQAHWPY
jgi:hypothetical protein